MAHLIFLDAGVVGLLCSSLTKPYVAACDAWLKRQIVNGALVYIADLTDFEVRRELLRIRATAELRRLDDLRTTIDTIRVDPPAWFRAAEFWAIVRQAGLPTAAPDALDGDAILAAVVGTAPQPDDQATVATTNVGHFARFPGIDARRWEDIA